MVKFRVNFEPIDVDDKEEFERIYKGVRKLINQQYGEKIDEIIPSINKMYPINDDGFPI